MIDAHIEDVESIREESDEYKAFKAEYLEKRKEYADLDKDGNPKLTSLPQNPSMSTYLVKDREDEFKKVEEKMTKKYDKVIKANEEKLINFEKALDLPCGLTFITVKPEDLPELKNSQMDVIDFMLDLDEPVKEEKNDK